MKLIDGNEAVGVLGMLFSATDAANFEGVDAGPEETDEDALLIVLFADNG